jgi:hypothetical protein
MSISALENENGECDELIAHLRKRQQWHRRKMKNVHGTEDYRMGYGAGLDGFDPDEATLAGYEELYPGYGQGLRDGRRAFEMAEAATKPEGE